MRFIIPKNFKPRKTWVVLGIAVGIGLLAALAARSYLSAQMEAIEASSRGRKISIVVAKHELKKGERLSADNLAVRPIPVDYAHSGAVTPEEFDRLDGQTLAFPVKGGEMILWGLLESKRSPTFSARIEEGRRAITVPVDEINSISGMLEPGDMVDLIVTLDQKGKKITAPLLQKVMVMATGQRSVDDPKSGERREYSTVTLDTTPEQAKDVIVAREVGKITALLRNPHDTRTVGNSIIDINASLQDKAIDREVPVLYGGKEAKFPTDALQLRGHSTAQDSLVISSVPVQEKASLHLETVLSR